MASRSTAETRRRPRREASSASPAASATRVGEAHYRDVVWQLQGEFARVVAALEARAASLEQLNEELQTEVSTLREQLSASTAREAAWQQAVSEAQEQAAMAREESAAKDALARDWEAQCAQLREQLQNHHKQFEMERETVKRDQERAARELSKAAAQLAQEQQRSAHMSQEVQLLECRVDSAVKTSRSFEARLQQLKQLTRDEKSDLEAQVVHLKTRLEDKKEQNRYLAEALMDKEARRAARKERDQEQKRHTIVVTSDASISSSDATVDALRKHRELRVAKASSPVKTSTTTTRYQLPKAYEEKKHRYLYEGGSPLSGLIEDLCSHAPTSPTSSASPARSPRSSSSVSAAASATTTPTARTQRTNTTTSRSSSPTEVIRTTAKPRPSTTTTTREGVQSTRLKRELDSLRRKMNACYADTSSSLSPH